MYPPFPRWARALRDRLPRFARAGQTQFSRRFERRECVVVGAMGLVKVGADYPGLILELSRGGCSFRPASLYLLDRQGESVTVRCESFAAEGVIKATRPEAYGIQFLRELPGDIVERVARDHGGTLADWRPGAAA